jgi:hypothetical protein
MRVRVILSLDLPPRERRPGWIRPGRFVTAIAMLAVLPAALELPALAALALAAAVCCSLIVWDVIHYREHRLEVRQARP